MITSDDAQFSVGGLATESIDFKNLGFQTGLMAVRILNGEKPKDIPVQTLKNTKLMINKAAAERLNIEIPENLKERAELI